MCINHLLFTLVLPDTQIKELQRFKATDYNARHRMYKNMLKHNLSEYPREAQKEEQPTLLSENTEAP